MESEETEGVAIWCPSCRFEVYNETILDKVRILMIECGITETRARAIISRLNENGIIFKEIR